MPRKELRRILTILSSALGSSDLSVSILLTDDAEIKRLNREYRKKDKATDVLSFPTLPTTGRANPMFGQCLGDLVISIQTARRQAKEYGQSLESELRRLLVHGYLHLHGFDHEKVPAKVAARMRRMESKLLAELER